MFFMPTNATEIENIIQNLKPKHSSGPDMISNKLLKIISESISLSFACVINKCIVDGFFPIQ